MKRWLVLAIASMFILAAALPVFAGVGNLAPSGPHYNLNIIGVPKDKNPDMDNNNGHRIFVDLGKKDAANTKINLYNSDTDEVCGGEFDVIDANGTDGTAAFCLPNPDSDNDGNTEYSVWARPVGTPGGKASMNTCATDPDTDEEICSVAVLEVERVKGNKGFTDVSKYLLYIYFDLDEDGHIEHYNLFNDALEGYFWSYDNNGLKVLQLRFYPIPSEDIPAEWPTD